MNGLTADNIGEFLQSISLKEYITMFGSITDANPDNDTFKERVPFDLWPKQEECCDFLESALRALLPKSRQKGLSETAAERILKTLFSHENTKGVVISKSEDFAEDFLFARVLPKYDYLCKNFPGVFPALKKKPTKDTLEFEGGRVLKSLACSSTAAASMTLDFMVVDEAGGIDEQRGKLGGDKSVFEDILKNSLPALSQNKNAWVMVIGTSVAGSYYNKMVAKAYEAKNTGTFKYFFIAWNDQPGRDAEWYEREYDEHEESMFLQNPTTMDDFFYIKEGLVFQHFDSKEGGRHIKNFKTGEEFYRKHRGKLQKLKASFNLRYITAYDHGTSHPAVNLYGLHDQYSDILYIIDETFFPDKHGSDYMEIGSAIIQKKKEFPRLPDREVADGSIFNEVGARSIGQLFGDMDLKFRKARKHDEAASREVVACRFKNNTIIIHPNCFNLIAQLNGYRWDPSSKGEKPIQYNDDAIDALRYLCAECKIAQHKRVAPLPDTYGRENSGWNQRRQVGTVDMSQAWQGY